MTSVDKAAMGWSIVIVAIAVAIAGAGSSMDSGSPVMQEKTIMSQAEEREQAIARQMEMSQEEEREDAIAKQMGGEMVEEKVSLTAPRVEDVPQMTGPTTVEVSMPTGTSVPGCEETDTCFVPSSVSISAGSTVVWMNDDTAAHTVTSGSPATGPDGVFDSSLVMVGASFEVTFDDAGSIDYFCMVHPWMTGTVNVS